MPLLSSSRNKEAILDELEKLLSYRRDRRDRGDKKGLILCIANVRFLEILSRFYRKHLFSPRPLRLIFFVAAFQRQQSSAAIFTHRVPASAFGTGRGA
jgi:hypothetical protein